MAFKPNTRNKSRRYTVKKKGKLKQGDSRALHQQKPSMADIIKDTAAKKKKGQL